MEKGGRRPNLRALHPELPELHSLSRMSSLGDGRWLGKFKPNILCWLEPSL